MKKNILFFFLLIMGTSLQACLCTPLIEANKMLLETTIVTNSHEPTQEALEEAVEQIEKEEDALKKEIEEIKVHSKAQTEMNKEINLFLEKVKKENEILEKLIEMESVR